MGCLLVVFIFAIIGAFADGQPLVGFGLLGVLLVIGRFLLDSD